jgi:Glycosyl hydrolase family 10
MKSSLGVSALVAFAVKLFFRSTAGLLLVASPFISEACAADTALTAVPVSNLVALNPGFAVSKMPLPGAPAQAPLVLRMVSGGIATWAVPYGAASFHVILLRLDVANAAVGQGVAPDVDERLRVRIYTDDAIEADTALWTFTPRETWTIPVLGAKSLGLRVDEQHGGMGVFLIDAGFSSIPVSSATVRHQLESGSAYVNLGATPAQTAMQDYHPGETIPIQVEYAGNATRADVEVRISPSFGGDTWTRALNIPLHSVQGGSLGTGQWQVPQVYGPATLDLAVSVQGTQKYSRSIPIALAKRVDLASVKQNIFGIHSSTSGDFLVQDDFASLWGAKWGRLFLRWNLVEMQRGQYNWVMIDQLVDAYLRQHMNVMGVMGEVPPAWMTNPVQEMPPLYQKFVAAALEHFRGRIRYWDVYNEIDSKFYAKLGFDPNADPNGDVKVLRTELEQMQSFDPNLVKMCCSPGSSAWLQYSKRVFDSGLIGKIDIVSMHPYQTGPPEFSDNGMNYVDMVAKMRALTQLYGSTKPVWSTEANWLIGPAGVKGVIAPDVSEHEQSEYVVRANLLSLGLHVPYFIHSPFFYPFHKAELVDSLSSYANMAALFSDAQNVSSLPVMPDVYGVTASVAGKTVAALWTDSLQPVSVHVQGLSDFTIEDMYGNPLPTTQDPVLTGSPIYLLGQGSIQVLPAPRKALSERALATPSSWVAAANTRTENLAGGTHVVSQQESYNRLLSSPVFDVLPNNCYVITPTVILHRGGIGIVVSDPDTKRNLEAEFMYAATGNDRYSPRIRVRTTNDSHLSVFIEAENTHGAAVSDFEFSGAKISFCP